MNTTEYARRIAAELEYTLSRVDADAAEALADAILGAGKVFVAGAGRSGFAAKAFAMRLMHLGFNTFVVGETTTPDLAPGDLLFIASGSGETGSLVVMARKARSIGAKLATITVRPEGTIASLADVVVRVPAPTPKVDTGDGFTSIQPMGSLFEQSAFVYLDAVVMRLMERLGTDSHRMFEHHANLE